jgi:hypothetical protein
MKSKKTSSKQLEAKKTEPIKKKPIFFFFFFGIHGRSPTDLKPLKLNPPLLQGLKHEVPTKVALERVKNFEYSSSQLGKIADISQKAFWVSLIFCINKKKLTFKRVTWAVITCPAQWLVNKFTHQKAISVPNEPVVKDHGMALEDNV